MKDGHLQSLLRRGAPGCHGTILANCCFVSPTPLIGRKPREVRDHGESKSALSPSTLTKAHAAFQPNYRKAIFFVVAATVATEKISVTGKSAGVRPRALTPAIRQRPSTTKHVLRTAARAHGQAQPCHGPGHVCKLERPFLLSSAS